jgi:hypothetical protein
MAKAKANLDDTVSLFPFLDIMACLIGILVLLITAVTLAQISNQQEDPEDAQAVAEAQQRVMKYRQVVQTVEQDRRERERLEKLIAEAETVQQQLEQIEPEVAKLEAERREIEAMTSTIPNNSDRLQEQAKQQEQQIKQDQEKLRELQQQRDELKKKLESIEQPPPEAEIQIVPSGTGTDLKPTFVECAAGAVDLARRPARDAHPHRQSGRQRGVCTIDGASQAATGRIDHLPGPSRRDFDVQLRTQSGTPELRDQRKTGRRRAGETGPQPVPAGRCQAMKSRRGADEMNLDFLLDTLTNVVGILILILVLNTLDIKQAVERIRELDPSQFGITVEQLTEIEQQQQEARTEVTQLATQAFGVDVVLDENRRELQQLQVQLVELRRTMPERPPDDPAKEVRQLVQTQEKTVRAVGTAVREDRGGSRADAGTRRRQAGDESPRPESRVPAQSASRSRRRPSRHVPVPRGRVDVLRSGSASRAGSETRPVPDAPAVGQSGRGRRDRLPAIGRQLQPRSAERRRLPHAVGRPELQSRLVLRIPGVRRDARAFPELQFAVSVGPAQDAPREKLRPLPGLAGQL